MIIVGQRIIISFQMSEVPKEPEYEESDSDTDLPAVDPDLAGTVYSSSLAPPNPDAVKDALAAPPQQDLIDAFLERPYKRPTARRQRISSADLSLEVFLCYFLTFHSSILI